MIATVARRRFGDTLPGVDGPEDAKSWQLRATGDLSEEVRRVARAITEDNLKRLGDMAKRPAPSIHAFRRNNKRLVALFRLARPSLGEARYRRERAWLRASSRLLSAPREAEVMLHTLASLFPSLPDDLLPLVALLETRRREALVECTAPGAMVGARQLVEGALAGLSDLYLDGLSRERLMDGVTDSYRSARRRLRRALAYPSSQRLHRLRQRVKVHRYQAKMLEALGPSSWEARDLELDTLGDWLGEEHDLADLTEVALRKASQALEAGALAELLRATQERQAWLRKHVFHAGGELFREKPRHFAAQALGGLL